MLNYCLLIFDSFDIRWFFTLSFLAGNSDHLKAGGDGLKGDNPPPGSKKSDDTSSQSSQLKPLDWREFRALLYIQEQVLLIVQFLHM